MTDFHVPSVMFIVRGLISTCSLALFLNFESVDDNCRYVLLLSAAAAVQEQMELDMVELRCDLPASSATAVTLPTTTSKSVANLNNFVFLFCFAGLYCQKCSAL